MPLTLRPTGLASPAYKTRKTGRTMGRRSAGILVDGKRRRLKVGAKWRKTT